MGEHHSAGIGRRGCAGIALVAALLAPRLAAAQECAQPHPDWLFCDDFESNADQDGQLGLWDDQGLGPQNLVLATDPAKVHGGSRALEIAAHKGQDTGGGPTKWFLPGSDEVYVRFFVRFSADYNFLHHMVFIGASEASNQWAAFGTAGCRPSGSNFFMTSVEPTSGFGAHPPPGAWGFYTYSNDMQCDPGSNCANYADPQQICDECATKGSPCDNGLECCWGTNDTTSPPVISALGGWTCIEARLKANSNGQSDGVQTLWIDGAQVGEWSGIRFRTDDALKINSLGLWHYVTDDVYASGQTEETVWFDDVVVSTSPIGCDGQGTTGAGAGGTTGAATGAGGSRTSGGASGPGAGAPTGTTSGGADGANGETAEGGGEGDSGCGCRVAAERSADRAGWLIFGALALASIVRARRRASRLRLLALGACVAPALGCGGDPDTSPAGASGGSGAAGATGATASTSATGASATSSGAGGGSGTGVGWDRKPDQWWDRLETAGTVDFTLARPSAEGALTVTWETADGTAVGGTQCGDDSTDFVAVTGAKATFADGQTTTTASVTPCHNGAFDAEPHEDFVLRVVDADGQPISRAEARAVIIDEDGNRYWNSSEPGCDGSDPGVVWCDDFEDQVAWKRDCDGNDDFGNSTHEHGPDVADNDGFCGVLVAFSGGLAENPSRARCGEPGAMTGGAAGTRCALDFGPHKDGSDAGMAFHGFSAPTEPPHEAWFRFYWTAEPGTKFINNSKGPWYPHEWTDDGAGITWGGLAMGTAGSCGGPMTDTTVGICPAANACEFGAGGCPENGISGLIYMTPNTADVPSKHPGYATLGHWNFVEIYMRLNDAGVRNGKLEMWMADCGVDGRGCPPGSEVLVMEYNELWWWDGVQYTNPGPIGSLFMEQWDNPGGEVIGGRAFIDQWKVSYSGPIGPMAVQ